MNEYLKYKNMFTRFAIIILIIGSLGIYDIKNRSYTGFQTDENNSVTKVDPSSPAEKAQFQIGDKIKNISGVDVSNTSALLKFSRLKAGEIRSYKLERNNINFNIMLVAESLPIKEVLRLIMLSIIGFTFLGVGLFSFLNFNNKFTLLFALVSFSAAVDFIIHPYIESYSIRLAYQIILNIIAFCGYAFLLHFTLEFPKQKQMLKKKLSLILVYEPVMLLSVIFIAIAVLQPERTHWLFTAAAVLYSLFFISYLGASIIAIIHSYMKATRVERSQSRLKLILFGLIAGLVPSIIAGIFNYLLPSNLLFGAEFYLSTVILIPVSFAIAFSKMKNGTLPIT